MSKSDCLNANWSQVGFDVAMQGALDVDAEYQKREKVCTKHGAIANYQAYLEGISEGVEQYCSIENAVNLGARGNTKAVKNNLCPELDHPGFESAFDAGYKLHVLQSRADEIQYEINRLSDQEYRYQRRRQELRHQIRSGELTDQELRRAQYRSRDLRHDIGDIRSRIYNYEREMVQRQRAADAYAELLKLEYLDLFE